MGLDRNGERGALVQLYVDGELTARTAAAFCEAADEALAGGGGVLVSAEDVKAVDAVGLAALLQASRRAVAAASPWRVIPSPVLHRALLTAGLLDDVPAGVADARLERGPVRAVPAFPKRDASEVLIADERVTLRLPSWEDLAHFDQWAAEPLLDQMVGSPLLYRCRHLGAYHADFVGEVTADPTALTALITQPDEGPAGFVRLYNINLLEGFAFLETAVTDRHALRRSWGVLASRLLLTYAMDVFDIRRVETKVYAYNLLSVNALKRNGFVLEGRLRQARDYDGRRWDMLVFGMLRDEMVAQRARGRFPVVRLWPPPRT